MILLCLTVLFAGFFAGVVAHYVFSKSPDPHEAAVGRAMLPYLGITRPDYLHGGYLAVFKSSHVGDGDLLDTTGNTLPKVLGTLFDRFFGVYRSRGEHIQKAYRRLSLGRVRIKELEQLAKRRGEQATQTATALAIYKNQAIGGDEKTATVTRRLLLLAKDLVDIYEGIL